MPAWFSIVVIAAVGIVALVASTRTAFTRSREGKILIFVALLILPIVGATAGFETHMDRATSTDFCLSCHTMSEHGRSLYIDDPSYIPARHFQNNLVPRDHACYTCHTDYTLFGGVNAKLRGLRHLYVQYIKGPPAPKDIKLYTPYNNRECLHCHSGMRKFEESSSHQKMPDLLTKVKSGQLSCLSSGCHEFVHDVGSLKDATFWKEH